MSSVKNFATPDRPRWDQRLHPNGRATGVRSSFGIDRDRIIHSDTFRELQHKTQVQSVRSAGPRVGFFRTRLNHVIEVAQIARGLAVEIGANVDLAEGIALAHDLGHPPFGHAGERGLSAALAEYGSRMERQRALTRRRRRDGGRLRPVRRAQSHLGNEEGIARHATPFDEPVGFGEFAESPNSGLESQIVDAADVMAYLAHDLDDALRGGYIVDDELTSVSPILADIADIPSAQWRHSPWPPEERDLIARRRLVAKLIGRLVGDLTSATTDRIAQLGVEDAHDVRASSNRVVILTAAYEELTRVLLNLLVERYYRSSIVIESDAEAVEIVKGLFTVLLDDPNLIPPRFRANTLPCE